MVGKTEDLSPRHSISDTSEGLLRRGKGEPGYTGIFATKTRQSKCGIWHFSMYGGMKEAGLTEIIPLMYLGYLRQASCFLIFHIFNSSFTSFLVQLTAAGLQALFSISGPLRPQKFIFEGLNSLMAVISLFIDVAGDIPFHSPNPQYLPLTMTLFGDEVIEVRSGH